MKNLISLIVLWVFAATCFSQTVITGKVMEISAESKQGPLPGANVYWEGTQLGVITNEKGEFSIEMPDSLHVLVASFMGYESQTIHIRNGERYLTFKLKAGKQLDDAEVVIRSSGTDVSLINPKNIQKIGQKELKKAACCNLAESFETNPSIDASFTDAVTGTKQIQMLGLAGKYTQLMQDNVPAVRGLASVYGLEFIPGPWINSIYVSKGAGSVANGFESITGQINVDMKKPGEAEKLFLNGYASNAGRFEFNAVTSHQVSDKWSTAVLLHAKDQQFEFDMNHDGFLDNPITSTYALNNEWYYRSGKGIQSEIGVSGIQFNSRSGQIAHEDSHSHHPLYEINTSIERFSGFSKIGYLFPDEDHKSIGLQISGNYYNQESLFGNISYSGNQQSFYANLLFQNELDSLDEITYRIGASFQYDKTDETFNKMLFYREEVVPGMFGELNINKTRWSSVLGFRADLHNLYGLLWSPRLHARYSATEKTSFKLAAGKGYRTPNIFTDNVGLLATARVWNINGNSTNGAYGFAMEEAWNIGLNATKEFKLNYREGNILIDLYRTQFVQQVVVDIDQSAREVNLYNLTGQSFANTAQVEVNYNIMKRTDFRIAYRYVDTRTDFSKGLLYRPLIPIHRAFANLGYETARKGKQDKHWKTDLTLQWFGKARVPFTAENPEGLKRPEYSPDFFMLNAQVTYVANKKFEFYVGGENLTNYRQLNPIIDPQNPFDEYFDSSIVWGPIFGVMGYVGFRWTINHKEEKTHQH
jgi:outer membrane receptor for ferrienterochelin and colicins